MSIARSYFFWQRLMLMCFRSWCCTLCFALQHFRSSNQPLTKKDRLFKQMDNAFVPSTTIYVDSPFLPFPSEVNFPLRSGICRFALYQSLMQAGESLLVTVITLSLLGKYLHLSCHFFFALRIRCGIDAYYYNTDV